MGKSLSGKELGKGFTQRKDGRYEARATINGIKIDIIEKDLKKLKNLFVEAKNNVYLQQVKTQKYKLSEWYDIWFDNCKKAQLKNEISRKTYKRKAGNTFVEILGSKNISDITQLDIQNATNDLQESGYKEKTVREAIGVMRECFEVAIANNYAKVNPCVCISLAPNRMTQTERRVLDVWEQELLLDVVKDRYYEIPYKILLSTGMRIGEFSGLQWSDIDFTRKVFRISRTMSTGYIDGKKIMEFAPPKTLNSYRDIPFFGETEELMKEWKKKQDEYKQHLGSRWRSGCEFGDLVFTTTMGSPVTRYNLIHDIKQVEEDMIAREKLMARKEGRIERRINHIHPHAFRHTFCTRCFEKGMDPIVIQKIMGHASYATTISYTHVLEDKRKEEIVKVGNFL